MRKVALGMLFAGFVGAQAFAGTVTFAPESGNVNRGDVVEMQVSLNATSGVTTISGGDIVIGSNDVAFSFTYSPAFTSAMPNVTAPGPVGVYTNDFLVGGSNPTTGAGTSLVLGTVTVQTAGLADGTYGIEVNTDIDGFSGIFRGLPGQAFVSEGLSGRGSFTVVPEPATLSLLGLGVLGLIRRRFAA